MRNYDINFDISSGEIKFIRANCGDKESFNQIYNNNVKKVKLKKKKSA